MKKLNKKICIKALILSFVFILSLGVIQTTLALKQTSTKDVENTFKVANIDTDIEEDGLDELIKKITIKNTGDASSYIRIRVVATPSNVISQINDKIKKNGWVYSEEDEFWYYPEKVEAGKDTATLEIPYEISKDIDWKTYPDKDNVNVTVYSEAIQANIPGCDTYQKAWDYFKTHDNN